MVCEGKMVKRLNVPANLLVAADGNGDCDAHTDPQGAGLRPSHSMQGTAQPREDHSQSELITLSSLGMKKIYSLLLAPMDYKESKHGHCIHTNTFFCMH